MRLLAFMILGSVACTGTAPGPETAAPGRPPGIGMLAHSKYRNRVATSIRAPGFLVIHASIHVQRTLLSCDPWSPRCFAASRRSCW